VLVVPGVSLALLATSLARQHTRLNDSAYDATIRRGLAGHDSTCGGADVGAVHAEPHAADHVPDVVFAEVRVGAARARKGAVVARLDTAHTRFEIAAERRGMRLEHLSNGHGSTIVRAPESVNPRCR
jgi:hypothetical protein